MRTRAAAAVVVVLGLAACAAPPSPTASALPPGTAASSAAAPSTAATSELPVLAVGWETRDLGASLLVVDVGGAIVRRPLPAIPDGQLAGAPGGALVFLSGPPDAPVLWRANGAAGENGWSPTALAVPGPVDGPDAWPCLSAAAAPRLAVEVSIGGILVIGVVDDGALATLPAGRLALRPGGCAWLEGEHLLVAVDSPDPIPRLGVAAIALDGSGGRLLDGPGGEEPSVSAGHLARVEHDGADYRLAVGPLPTESGALPAPTLRLVPDGEHAFVRPVLSADGRRLAVLEEDAAARPLRLLVYELGTGSARLLAAIDVAGARAAGPAWVADPPQP